MTVCMAEVTTKATVNLKRVYSNRNVRDISEDVTKASAYKCDSFNRVPGSFTLYYSLNKKHNTK